MKEIDISSQKYPNTFALVDDEDYKRINKHRWFVSRSCGRKCARRNITVNKKGTSVLMHREILFVPKGVLVDHIDHNPLNNQKLNIRLCTNSQNQMNRRPHNGTSGYKGVFWRKDINKWRTTITKDGKVVRIGHYIDEIDAARAYDVAAIEQFGEFAWLNDIPDEA